MFILPEIIWIWEYVEKHTRRTTYQDTLSIPADIFLLTLYTSHDIWYDSVHQWSNYTVMIFHSLDKSPLEVNILRCKINSLPYHCIVIEHTCNYNIHFRFHYSNDLLWKGVTFHGTILSSLGKILTKITRYWIQRDTNKNRNLVKPWICKGELLGVPFTKMD